MIKAILVDDEAHCLDTLSILIKEYCPEVEIVEQCSSAKKALAAIENLQPNLVFLDIEMPVMNGFELLEQFKEIRFSVIFTTSYDQYAIKAIRFSALDYLLKPIDPRELQAAVAKVKQNDQQSMLPAQLQLLLQSIREPATSVSRIALPTLEGLQMVTIDTILYCMANSNYTTFVMNDKKKLVISRTLKEIEEMLEDHGFLRIHHSHLVNISAIEKYIRGEGGTVVMNDGTELDVSRSRKETLLKTLQSRK